MLTLYSYPELFGVADNNGYGLKVFAFLKLAGVPFVHEHIFDASAAPRGQLPYIVDDGETIGDSETIIAHLDRKISPDHRCGADACAARHRSSRHPHARRSLLGDVVFALEGRAVFSGVPRRASSRSIRRSTRPAWTRRGSTTPSAIISRASAATRRSRLMREGSPICRCWRDRSGGRLCAWRQRRPASSRHLRLHRQHLFLRDRRRR